MPLPYREMRVLAVPRSMAMSLEIAPKREEIIQGPEGLGAGRVRPAASATTRLTP
jgi:hypothetical protein